MPKNDPYAQTQNPDGSWSTSTFQGYETGPSTRPSNGSSKSSSDKAPTYAGPKWEDQSEEMQISAYMSGLPGWQREIVKDQIKTKVEEQRKSTEALRGRQLVDDEKWQTLISLGYSEDQLRQKYVPQAEKALIDLIGADEYFNAPMFQKKEQLLPDQGTRALITQQVLAPYLQKLGNDFKGLQTGLRETNNNLLNQMDPTYRPFMEAINNNMYAAQDQSWINTLNSVATVPMFDQFNQLLAQNLAAQSKAGSGGGSFEDIFGEQMTK